MKQVTRVNYLIIGAGPAGLQLGYFLHREGRDYLILDAADRPGTFFEQYPRHETLLSINKVHTGYDDRDSQLRYDWNSLISDEQDLAFTRYSEEYFPSARLYAQYLRDFAARTGLQVRYNTRAAEVVRGDGAEDNYVVTDQDGNHYACRALIVATGLWDPYVPDIPGIELTENYAEFSVDPKDYAGQRVLVVGKGNSAFETANALVSATRSTHVCSPHPVQLAWKSHYVGNLRAVNNDFLDTYVLKGQNALLDADITRIEKRDGEYIVDVAFTHANGQRAQFAYDRVLVCTGFRWDPSFFSEDCQPESTPCGCLPAMTSAWESANLPHVYYAGTLMQARDRHKTMSNVLHGFRSNIKSLADILQERYDDQPWPCDRLPLTSEAVARKIIQRVSTDPGMMLQPGFLCDVMVVKGDCVEYYETLAVEYVRDSRFGEEADYYTITMEYGDTLDDVLAVNRQPDASKAYNDFYIHPRIQRFSRGVRVGEHHIAESLENDWRWDAHAGQTPLIRQMSFQDQDDPTRFQHTHREGLVAFLERQLPVSVVATGAV